MAMTIPGIGQTLPCYQGNRVTACEKLDCKTHGNTFNGLIFSLACDHGVSGIIPFEVSINWN